MNYEFTPRYKSEPLGKTVWYKFVLVQTIDEPLIKKLQLFSMIVLFTYWPQVLFVVLAPGLLRFIALCNRRSY